MLLPGCNSNQLRVLWCVNSHITSDLSLYCLFNFISFFFKPEWDWETGLNHFKWWFPFSPHPFFLVAEIRPCPTGSAWLQAVLHVWDVVVWCRPDGCRGTGELCSLWFCPSIADCPTGLCVCNRWVCFWSLFTFLKGYERNLATIT